MVVDAVKSDKKRRNFGSWDLAIPMEFIYIYIYIYKGLPCSTAKWLERTSGHSSERTVNEEHPSLWQKEDFQM